MLILVFLDPINDDTFFAFRKFLFFLSYCCNKSPPPSEHDVLFEWCLKMLRKSERWRLQWITNQNLATQFIIRIATSRHSWHSNVLKHGETSLACFFMKYQIKRPDITERFNIHAKVGKSLFGSLQACQKNKVSDANFNLVSILHSIEGNDVCVLQVPSDHRKEILSLFSTLSHIFMKGREVSLGLSEFQLDRWLIEIPFRSPRTFQHRHTRQSYRRR